MKASELNPFRASVLATLLVLNSGCSSPPAVTPAVEQQARAAVEVPKQIVSLGHYRLEIYSQSELKPARFMFIKNGKVAYAGSVESGSQLTIVIMQPADETDDNPAANRGQIEEYNPDNDVVEQAEDIEAKDADIRNLTHDSSPVVMLEKKNTGNYEYSLFRLGASIEKFATIKNGRYRVKVERTEAETASPDEPSGGPRIYTNDIYQNWGARSVMPEIVLRLDHGRFVPDVKSMRQSAPDLDGLAGLKASILEEFPKYKGLSGVYSAPPELSDELLELCYEGNAKSARQFLDRCWPRRKKGKAAYWAALVKEMHNSMYWSTVRELNGSCI